VNTTPIIALADIEQMDLLQKIYGKIVVLGEFADV
jgi:predicted nucleic acid-binding protein